MYFVIVEPGIYLFYDNHDFCHNVEAIIEDMTGATSSVTKPSPQFVTQQLGCFALGNQFVIFPFSSFTGVDLEDVASVEIKVDAIAQGIDGLDFVYDIITGMQNLAWKTVIILTFSEAC